MDTNEERIEIPGMGISDAVLPSEIHDLLRANDQTAIPTIAKTPKLAHMALGLAKRVSTTHRIICDDSRNLGKPGAAAFVETESVHLVVTSPPYWNLKRYPSHDGQLGSIDEYERFLAELDRIWREAYRVLVPGGRMVVVVGDVNRSRKSFGRHVVMPLHAAIQEQCRRIGFDNLAPVFWYKIANAKFEAEGNSGRFLGKPYEPNAVIKNDVEYILFQRKPGQYRSPSLVARVFSVIPQPEHREWFQQIWRLPGASTARHPAPFPLALAERIVRMFSFVGDTVLDPFLGTGTTSVAAVRWGRNSIGIEIEPEYWAMACRSVRSAKDIEAAMQQFAFP